MKRTIKMLGLAAAAAMAVMAFVGVGPASASVLCHSDTTACAKKVAVNDVLKGTQLGTGTLTASSGVRISCTSSEFETKVTANPNGAGEVAGETQKLVFGGCTESLFGSSCEATVSTTPALPTTGVWTTAGTTGPNGTLTVKQVKAKVVCKTLGVTCEYEGAGAESSVSGNVYNADDTNKPSASAHAEVKFVNAELKSLTGGATCGTGNAKENTTYAGWDKTTESTEPELYLVKE